MASSNYIDLSKTQKIVGNLLFIFVLICISMFFVLSATKVFDISLKKFALPAVLIGLAIFLISVGFVQVFNTVLLWSGYLLLFIGLTVLSIHTVKFDTRYIGVLFCSSPLLASLLVMPLSVSKLLHLQVIVFCLGIAIIVFLSSHIVGLCVLFCFIFAILYCIISRLVRQKSHSD